MTRRAHEAFNRAYLAFKEAATVADAFAYTHDTEAEATRDWIHTLGGMFVFAQYHAAASRAADALATLRYIVAESNALTRRLQPRTEPSVLQRSIDLHFQRAAICSSPQPRT